MNLNKKFFPKRSLSATLLILLAGFIVYANSFQVPFVLDDYFFIEKNDVIRSLGNFFTNSTGYAFNPPRYVGILTFALNYHFGGLNVTGYHVVNLLIHLAAGLLVYVLLRLTFRTPYFQNVSQGPNTQPSTFNLQPASFIPLFAALLFVVHPVQTQAVTYIVQRMTSLATCFYLMSVVLYVAARLRLESRVPTPESKVRNHNPRDSKDFGPETLDQGPWTRRLAPLFLFAGSVFSAVLAMKTKEMAVTLPLAIVLYEALFFKGLWKRRLFYLLPILATLPIVPMSVLAPGVPTGDILSDVGDQLRAQSNMSRLDYLFTQFRVIVTYLRLLVLPVNQNLDYDYPVYTSFFIPPVFLSFLFLAALFCLAWYLWFSSNRESRVSRLISFGLLWFFLTLSVESSVIPIADVIFEHRLYLPSVGAAAVFAAGFFLVSRKVFRARAGALSTLVAALIIVCLGIATYQRNLVWGDEVGLWEDVVSKSPQKPRPYNNLGYALNKAGKPWDAIPNFMKALTFAPYYADANYNLGRAYLMVDQSAMAIPLLQKAISIQPNLSGAYSDLGAALNLEGRYQEAATFLEQNLGRFSQMPAAHFNLGVAYVYLGNQAAARRELETLARLDPELTSRLASLMRSNITK